MSTSSHTDILHNIPEYVQALKPYKPGKPLDEMKAEYGLEHIIKLASNENPFGPSPKALEAIQKVENELFRYPDPISRRLKNKLAKALDVNEKQIIVGAGSESLLALICRTVLKPGDLALMGEGAFLGFPVHLSAMGGKLKTVPSPNYRFDVDALIQNITPETKLLYLPNPNNPTGTYITTDELNKIVTALPASCLLVIDEAYVEFCCFVDNPPEGYPNSLDALKNHPNVILLRTFSKAYGLAGLRVGYGIGDTYLIEQMTKVKMTFEVSLLAQVAAEAAWDDTEHIQRTVENNNNQLLRYYQVLEELKLQYVKSYGNFVLIELDDESKVNNLNEVLLKQGIAIRPLAAFGFPTCLRISIGLPAENDMVFAALRAYFN